jgi:hypothetical protein
MAAAVVVAGSRQCALRGVRVSAMCAHVDRFDCGFGHPGGISRKTWRTPCQLWHRMPRLRDLSLLNEPRVHQPTQHGLLAGVTTSPSAVGARTRTHGA